MGKYIRHLAVLAGLFLGISILPAASQAPSSKKARRIDYISDYQVAEYEKYGIEQELGKMVKHRDDTGGINTISWDKDED